MNFTIQATTNGNTITFEETFRFPSPQTIVTLIEATDPEKGSLADSRDKEVRKLNSKLAPDQNLYLYNVTWKAYDAYTWTALYTYSPQNRQYADKLLTVKKPWDRKPNIRKVQVEFYEVQDRYYEKNDKRGKPTGVLLLPNGRPFSTPPQKKINGERIVISWYLKNVNDEAVDTCRFTLNKNPVAIDGIIYPAKELYMESCYYTPLYDEKEKEYYFVEATILYRLGGHNFKPLYADYYAKFNGKLAEVQFDSENGIYGTWPKDKTKPRVVDPVFLNDEGGLLTTEAGKKVTPKFGDFQTDPELDWAPLKIPKVKGVKA